MNQAPVHKISLLNERQIVKWVGAEMALSEGEPCDCADAAINNCTIHPPVLWQHPSVPYLQFTVIDMHLADGRVFQLFSQAEDGTGHHGFFLVEIQSNEQLIPDHPEKGSIYRTQVLHELPVGIARITVVRRNGPNADIEATISIDGNTIRIFAAEVEEIAYGRFRIVDCDESILLQLNGIRPIPL